MNLSAGGIATATTDANGQYRLTGIAAGLVFIEASHPDYATQTKSTDLVSGQTNQVDFALVVQPRLRIERASEAVVISWPASLEGFHLQTGQSLNAEAPWALEGSVPAIVNGRYTVTNDLDSADRGYQ
ncbi:MAG: carboxypeptidase-like regulatory domain-containing protein, partial [Candidatus Omnitrophica bacterium]|nr:carboxypeptidase-like regulatory domain-containing protein [Candidatus Omnitrophota bacterium]